MFIVKQKKSTHKELNNLLVRCLSVGIFFLLLIFFILSKISLFFVKPITLSKKCSKKRGSSSVLLKANHSCIDEKVNGSFSQSKKDMLQDESDSKNKINSPVYSDLELDKLFKLYFSLDSSEKSSSSLSLIKIKEKSKKIEIQKKESAKIVPKKNIKVVSKKDAEKKDISKDEHVKKEKKITQVSLPVKLPIKEDVKTVPLVNSVGIVASVALPEVVELKKNVDNHVKQIPVYSLNDNNLPETDEVDDENSYQVENGSSFDTMSVHEYQSNQECITFIDRITKLLSRFPGRRTSCIIDCTYSMDCKIKQIEITGEKSPSPAYKAHLISILQRTLAPYILRGKTVKIII